MFKNASVSKIHGEIPINNNPFWFRFFVGFLIGFSIMFLGIIIASEIYCHYYGIHNSNTLSPTISNNNMVIMLVLSDEELRNELINIWDSGNNAYFDGDKFIVESSFSYEQEAFWKVLREDVPFIPDTEQGEHVNE